ncbi:MAG: trimethylamine methyltransferase family protein, partial [Firmicutes bacterium]|nr:trimethylamine methyltransferase family protein [Bacillota bacterium]
GDNVDMTTVHVTYSRPEYLIMLSGAAQVLRYLGLPCCSNLGATANGKFDAEAAFETTVALYTSMLSGVNMAFTNGAMECGKSSSIEELVFADEVIGFLKVVNESQPVDEYHLAEDIINNVGPGGNFLMEQHTALGARQQWKSDCIKGLTYEDMQTAEMPDLGQRLRARAKAIIEAGPQHPLSDDILAKLDAIVARAQARVNAK